MEEVIGDIKNIKKHDEMIMILMKTIISGYLGSKLREVLMTLEEWDKLKDKKRK